MSGGPVTTLVISLARRRWRRHAALFCRPVSRKCGTRPPGLQVRLPSFSSHIEQRAFRDQQRPRARSPLPPAAAWKERRRRRRSATIARWISPRSASNRLFFCRRLSRLRGMTAGPMPVRPAAWNQRYDLARVRVDATWSCSPFDAARTTRRRPAGALPIAAIGAEAKRGAATGCCSVAERSDDCRQPNIAPHRRARWPALKPSFGAMRTNFWSASATTPRGESARRRATRPIRRQAIPCLRVSLELRTAMS